MAASGVIWFLSFLSDLNKRDESLKKKKVSKKKYQETGFIIVQSKFYHSKTKSQKEIVIGLFQLWHLLFSTDCLFLAYHTSKCYATEFTVLKYSKICYSRSLSLASKEMKNENKIKEQKKITGMLFKLGTFFDPRVNHSMLCRIFLENA